MAVGLGIVSSIGITMLVGLYFTTMHGIMPFLCLGESESSRLLFGMASFTTCLYDTYTEYRLQTDLTGCRTGNVLN